jgi:hypothetical protein
MENSGSSLPLSQLCTTVVWNSDALMGFKNVLIYAEKILQHPVNNFHAFLTYRVLYICIYKHNVFFTQSNVPGLSCDKEGRWTVLLVLYEK